MVDVGLGTNSRIADKRSVRIPHTRRNGNMMASTSKPPPMVRYFGLRFLLFYILLLLGFFRVATRFQPRNQPFRLARFAGWLQRVDLRDRILYNVNRAFSDEPLSPEKLEAIWEGHLKHMGLTLMETPRLLRMSPQQVSEHIRFEGEEHLKAALSQGRGVVVFLSHLGHFSLVIGFLAKRGYDVTVAGAVPPLVGWRLRKNYSRVGAKLVVIGSKGLFPAAETLRRNGLLIVFFDHCMTEKHSVWAECGLNGMRMHIGPAILALRQRAPALYVSSRRIGECRHVIRADPAVEHPLDGRLEERAAVLTGRIASTFIAELRERADQWWLWNTAAIRTPRRAEPTTVATQHSLTT